jgi:ketosteroid isomerase-like protein
MSQENVEIVRRAMDAFNRSDLDGAMRDTDAEVELDWSRSRGLQAGIYRGQEASRGFWASWLEMFDRVVVIPEEFIECGEHVVVPNTAHLQGRDGVEVEAKSVSVVTLRNGRIVEWRLYQERAEALEAVGLSEQDAHADS